MTLIVAARRTLVAAWWLALVASLAAALSTHLLPTVVVGGGSMEPAISRGSLIVLERIHEDDGVAPGDIVTVRAANGILVTHRVTRSISLAEGWHVELRGDANPTPDPVLVPTAAVVGRVAVSLPYVGYLVALLATPLGWLSVTSFLGAGMLAVRLLEDLENRPRSVLVTS